MSKLPARLFALTAFSVLLTGCELPTSLDDFVGYREAFFLKVSPEQIAHFLGPVIILLATVATLSCLGASLINLAKGKIISQGLITSVLLLFSLVTLFLFIPFTSGIGKLILPAELTLDNIFKAMRWDVSDLKGLSNLVTASWAITLTLLIPQISNLWQIVMLVMTTLALGWSIIGRSLKGLAFIVGEVFGWATFLALFNTIVQFFGANYPDDGWLKFAPVGIVMNAFYVGILLITLGVCYIGVPVIAAILAPDLKEDDRAEVNHDTMEKHSHTNWDGILAIPMPQIPHPPTQDVPSNETYDQPNQSPPPKFPQLPWPRSQSGSNGAADPVIPGQPGQNGNAITSDKSDAAKTRWSGSLNPTIPNATPPTDVLLIECDQCGAFIPITETNCPYCLTGLNDEKASLAQADAVAQGLAKKQKIGLAGRIFAAAASLIIPEAAPIFIPTTQATVELANQAIDRDTAKKTGLTHLNPRFEDTISPTVKLVGGVTGNQDMVNLGHTLHKGRSSKPTPKIP